MSLYLGLDSSTQSVSAVVLEADGAARRVVWEHSLAFDRVNPGYGTRHGVLPAPAPGVAVAPPLLWVEALDAILHALTASGLPVERLAAIAGSAQQHGSVYLNDRFVRTLGGMRPGDPPAPQLAAMFSREVAPIWMDSSTSIECREIADAAGGAARLAAATGSRAFERFTGPQIRRFFKTDPDRYAETARVHLVSSFLASVLAGADAPIDPGDGSGMNLMALASSAWWAPALAATAPDLERRLPRIVPAATVIGRLSSYWQARLGLPPARLAAWTGDNPSSLVGTGLVREGRVAISLGTSDTIFGLMSAPRVDASGTGHVFGAPTGAFMGLTVFRNGSLARERVRDDHGLDWRGFSDALAATPPGNGGAMMLPWFDPEITPSVPTPGVHRHALEPGDAPRHVRAVVEAQMMALANHSRWMGVMVDEIRATGGAATNDAILQVMADVFGATVRRFAVGNSAALGAALRALHADLVAEGHNPDWEEIVAGVAEPADQRIVPRPDATRVYSELRRRYAEFEAKERKGLG